MTAHTQEHGRFRFDMSYRRMRGDEGLSLRVTGPVENETRELLRFDCFVNAPHYHVEVYGKNEITAIKDGDPADWSLNTLRSRFEDLINEAGADALTAEERNGLSHAIEAVSEKSLALITEETAA